MEMVDLLIRRGARDPENPDQEVAGPAMSTEQVASNEVLTNGARDGLDAVDNADHSSLANCNSQSTVAVSREKLTTSVQEEEEEEISKARAAISIETLYDVPENSPQDPYKICTPHQEVSEDDPVELMVAPDPEASRRVIMKNDASTALASEVEEMKHKLAVDAAYTLEKADELADDSETSSTLREGLAQGPPETCQLPEAVPVPEEGSHYQRRSTISAEASVATTYSSLLYSPYGLAAAAVGVAIVGIGWTWLRRG